MRYHAYFFDIHGEPYVKVQLDNRESAIEMMTKYADRRFIPVLKCEFQASTDDMVLIFCEGFMPRH